MGGGASVPAEMKQKLALTCVNAKHDHKRICGDSINFGNYTKKVVAKTDAAPEKEELLDSFEAVKYGKGTTIIKQGDRGDDFFVMEMGTVEFYIEGNKKAVGACGSGKGFGELALMYNTPRAATVLAKTDIIAWKIDRERFRLVLANHAKARGLTKLADCMDEEDVDDGVDIIKEGEDGHTFYIIANGEVEVSTAKAGKVASLKKGDYFGTARREAEVIMEELPPLLDASEVVAERLDAADAGSSTEDDEPCEPIMGWCHTCAASVRTRVDEETCEVECMRCSGTFVEVNPASDDRGLSDFLAPAPAPPAAGAPAPAPAGAAPTTGEPPGELVAGAIQQILSQVLAGGQASGGGEANVQVLGAMRPLFATTIGAGGGGIALGDYAVGNLSNVIEQLVNADQARPKPASKRALARLCAVVDCGDAEIAAGWECAIHKEAFVPGDRAMRLPCGHLLAAPAPARGCRPAGPAGRAGRAESEDDLPPAAHE
ncbi:cGMP-dependent protein kinase [Aureococcus anophagefferens]|nr:cGMP-dependent protein kinase [Aureococcus anophagefferens]